MPLANKGKPHIRTIQKARIAVRLEMRNLGIPLQDIAAFIGISPSAFSILRKTNLYKILKNQYQSGILSFLDADLADNLDEDLHALKLGRKISIENLLYFASRRDEPKYCMEATKEILNREGNFAAVSRIGLPTKDQGGITNKEDEQMALELLAALSKKKQLENQNESLEEKDNITETVQ